MQATIAAVCLLQDSALRRRIQRFCAIQGWSVRSIPHVQRLTPPADLIFVDDAATADLVDTSQPQAVTVVFLPSTTPTASADEGVTSVYEPAERAQPGLQLIFDAQVADHQLLDGITTALNLSRFRRQFATSNQAEPITKLPHHTELLAMMAQHRDEPTGLLIVQIDHADHLYANLDPVSKTDVLDALSDHLARRMPDNAQMSIFDAACFAIWVTRSTAQEVNDLAEQACASAQSPVSFRSGELHFTVSVGHAFDQSLGNPNDLWQDAWQAKESAKAQGGNQTHAADSFQDLRTRIPEAIKQNEFNLVLQPQFDIGGQQLCGVETLLRWQGMEVGNLYPSHFIPVAERSGQMARVGDWVLERACIESATWFEHVIAPITIGINTAPAQFQNDAIQKQVERLASDNWLNPATLELELSHEDLLHVIEKHRGTLYRLRDAGVRVAIDNLGVGVVDTDKLLRCPADTLKIDRTLIARMETDNYARQLIEHICELGQRFNLRTVAVGVESERQRALLASLGCTDAQGYLFMAPIPLKEFQDFLLTEHRTQTG
ncbi:MAG: GGDEF domain-containing phosphodiesterase [Pseudomonadales bacterium]